MGEEGVIKEFILCGPFKYSRLLYDGLESFYLDFLNGEEKAILKDGLEVNGVKCRRVIADEKGFVDLVKIYGERFKDFWRLNYGVAYAYTEVKGSSCETVFLLGCEDYATVYVNGLKVFSTHVAKRFQDGFDAFPVKLEEGVNRVLLKIGRLAGRWGFSLKIVKTEKPFYVNKYRLVLPNAVIGERVNSWASIQVLALKELEKLSVEVLENDFWNHSKTEIHDAKKGERLNVPLFLSSKKTVRNSENLELEVYVEADGVSETIDFNLKIVQPLDHVIRTYRSKSDGSVQFYGIRLPLNSNGKLGLILLLHGFKGSPTPSAVYGEKDWCIVASPSARGEVPYREIGLLNVLEVMEEVKRRYPVNEDRIYLTGHSMGGYGTWFIGTRFPHYFAAIAPLSSSGDFSERINIVKKWKGWEGVAELLEHYNPARYIENLFSTPVFISHGSSDRIVPVESSRKMASKLSKLGFEYVYEEVPGADHVWGKYEPGKRYGLPALDRESIEKFFLNHVRQVPRRVVFKTDNLRFNKAWWVEILESNGFVYLIVEIKENGIEIIKADNVRKIKIDLKQLFEKNLLAPTENVVVRYDENVVEFPRPLANDEIYVEFTGHGLRVYGDEDPETIEDKEGIIVLPDGSGKILVKKPGLSGPFMDLFNSRFIIVPGSDPEAKDICYEAALHIQYWWNDYANGYTRIYYDYEILGKAFEERFNILAIGGPEVNKYVDKVIDEIKPLTIEGYETTLRNRKFNREDYGLALIYPNPLNKEKYIGLVGSNSVKSLKSLYRLDFTLIPDYLVYDSKYVGITPKGIVYSGFFNNYWL